MVIVHLAGGLGNQLFQYAFGRCLAEKNHTELKLDITNCPLNKNISHHAHYRLDAFNLYEHFATLEDLKNVNSGGWKILNDGLQPVGDDDNIFVSGFWMFDEKFFRDIKDILFKELTLKNPLGISSSMWERKIISAECAISLHIRHGDTILPNNRQSYGILPADYWFSCIDYLKHTYSNITVFVFSDDLEWAKNNLNFGVPTEFVNGCENDVEEIWLMSLCKHNIISSSTFSWWGSWLNKNPDKKVFIPNPRHRRASENNSPNDWIKIDVDYNKNPHIKFPPLLSIIVYVENDISTIEFLMPVMLKQKFDDYEIIIFDASTDKSGEICRKFAERDNVTIIKDSSSKGKLSAWNRGLNFASGEFVLLLTGKDYIASNITNLLIKIQNHFYSRYLDSPKNTLTYSNYWKISPNVICSFKWFEENEHGKMQVDGLSNRKVQVLSDVYFKNIQSFSEISFDSSQKLALLESRHLNTWFGTKFFKLKFLNDHNIRFDESLQGGGCYGKIPRRRFSVYRQYCSYPSTVLWAA